VGGAEKATTDGIKFVIVLLEVYLVPVRDAVQTKDPRNIDMATDLWNDRSKDRTRLMFLSTGAVLQTHLSTALNSLSDSVNSERGASFVAAVVVKRITVVKRYHSFCLCFSED
jgi:hypothetical protein